MTSPRPDTWMPWYIGDFMRDTMHLDHDQDAAYRRLIDACWMRNGQLPNDDAQLARICKMGPKLWRKVRPVVSEFFRIEADGWHHKRVDLELSKATRIVEERSQSGREGAVGKWGETTAAHDHSKTRSRRLAAARQISTHSAEEWISLLEIADGRCMRCGELSGKLVKDHITPIYQGGSDGIENLQPLCPHCNGAKGRENIDHRPDGWQIALAKRLAKRLANACEMAGPSPSPKESSLREEGAEGSALPAIQPARPPPATPKSIADGMVSAWKAELGDLLPVPIKITDALQRSAVLRWRDDFRSDADQWREYLRAIRGSPFLVGENDRGWRADFEWALRPRSVEKVRSGCYARARPSVPKVANGEFHLDRTEELRRGAREDIYRRTGKWQPEWGEPPSDNAARAPPPVRPH